MLSALWVCVLYIPQVLYWWCCWWGWWGWCHWLWFLLSFPSSSSSPSSQFVCLLLLLLNQVHHFRCDKCVFCSSMNAIFTIPPTFWCLHSGTYGHICFKGSRKSRHHKKVGSKSTFLSLSRECMWEGNCAWKKAEKFANEDNFMAVPSHYTIFNTIMVYHWFILFQRRCK